MVASSILMVVIDELLWWCFTVVIEVAGVLIALVYWVNAYWLDIGYVVFTG